MIKFLAYFKLISVSKELGVCAESRDHNVFHDSQLSLSNGSIKNNSMYCRQNLFLDTTGIVVEFTADC